MLGTAVLSRMELNQSNLDLNDVPNQTRNRNPNDLENQLTNMFSESEQGISITLMLLNLACNGIVVAMVACDFVWYAPLNQLTSLQITLAALFLTLIVLRMALPAVQWQHATYGGLKASLLLGLFVPSLKYHLIRTGKKNDLNIKRLLLVDFSMLVLQTVCFCVAALSSIASTSDLDVIQQAALAVDLTFVWPALTKLNHHWLLQIFLFKNAYVDRDQQN